jgi:hypothetical protein
LDKLAPILNLNPARPKLDQSIYQRTAASLSKLVYGVVTSLMRQIDVYRSTLLNPPAAATNDGNGRGGSSGRGSNNNHGQRGGGRGRPRGGGTARGQRGPGAPGGTSDQGRGAGITARAERQEKKQLEQDWDQRCPQL